MTTKEDVYQKALEAHRLSRGKLGMIPRMPVSSMAELALAYTPGVAEPCRVIAEKPEEVYNLTSKWNTVAVITDGSAVLGLGDIGPEASLPVMEGKSILFKAFANIDSFPLAISTQDVDDIVKIVSLITPSLGGINLEDISAPRCFEIEERLQEICDIPIFHDDQHGTAVICLAGLLNALKIVGKKIEDVKIVMTGAGAAGTAICKFLQSAGATNIIVCDRQGALYPGRDGMNTAKAQLAASSNPNQEKGSPEQVFTGADVFLGLSGPGTVTEEMVASMAPKGIVFAMANPVPEIFPDQAKAAGAHVVATGRSDFPNQLNNCLGFPGIFRGALDVRARQISEEMKLAAAQALADLVGDADLNPDYIIPDVFDKRVVPAVSKAVMEAARRSGQARI